MPTIPAPQTTMCWLIASRCASDYSDCRSDYRLSNRSHHQVSDRSDDHANDRTSSDAYYDTGYSFNERFDER